MAITIEISPNEKWVIISIGKSEFIVCHHIACKSGIRLLQERFFGYHDLENWKNIRTNKDVKYYLLKHSSSKGSIPAQVMNACVSIEKNKAFL